MIRKTVITGVTALALMVPASAMAQSTGEKVQFLNQQASGERLASQLIGLKVQNQSGEELGDVNDIVLNDKGQATGVVLGVGGLLGIAEKNVAVAYDRMAPTAKDKETVVVLNTTKAELEAAPDYKNAEGKTLSVSQRLGEEAKETYEKAKEQASETYNRAKENMTGEKKPSQ
jgi:sporulation protein YlmC with PRC-barrel domain